MYTDTSLTATNGRQTGMCWAIMLSTAAVRPPSHSLPTPDPPFSFIPLQECTSSAHKSPSGERLSQYSKSREPSDFTYPSFERVKRNGQLPLGVRGGGIRVDGQIFPLCFSLLTLDVYSQKIAPPLSQSCEKVASENYFIVTLITLPH